MRILIVSDTHRKNDNYLKLLKKQGYNPADITAGKLVGLSLTIKDYKKLAEEILKSIADIVQVN